MLAVLRRPRSWLLAVPVVAAVLAGGGAVASADTTTASIALRESLSPSTGVGVGTSVAYTFSVRNTGDVPLSSVTVADTVFGVVPCPLSAPLQPGDTVTCPVQTHVLTAADASGGTLTDTSTANAVATTGAPPETATASSILTFDGTPAANTVRLTGAGVVDGSGVTAGARLGDTISWFFTVTNGGPGALTGLTVTDKAKALICPHLPPGGLGDGATIVCTARRTGPVTAAQVHAGSVRVAAVASATFARGPAARAQAEAGIATVASGSGSNRLATTGNDLLMLGASGVLALSLGCLFLLLGARRPA